MSWRSLNGPPACGSALSQTFRPGTPEAFQERSSAREAQIDERVIVHHDERAIFEGQAAFAVVLDDLQLAHAVTHRAARVVVRL